MEAALGFQAGVDPAPIPARDFAGLSVFAS
jgi:hypothetical protein